MKPGILLIENNPLQAELTKAAILRSRITDNIHWAHDGEQAIDFLFDNEIGKDITLRQQPRIIILNLNLPKITAIDLLKKIKEHPETNKIIVMLLSESDENTDLVDAMKIGVNNCIVKRSPTENVADLIEQELGYYWKLF